MEAHANGWVEAEEAEINRLVAFRGAYPKQMKEAKYVLETNHSLYLTLLVASGEFYNKLSPEQKNLLSREARTLAHEERALSIRQEIENKKMLEGEGVTFTQLSDSDMKTLKKMSRKIHKKYKGQVGKILSAIRNTK